MPIKEIITIPKAGKERDNLIANMKGIKWNTTIIISDHFTEYPYNPSWSTSCSDAWELWEELEYPKSYEVLYGEQHIIKIFNRGIYFGESFADVVSQAWIIEKT